MIPSDNGLFDNGPRDNGPFDLQHEVDALHTDVRLGRFENCRKRVESCLSHRLTPGLDEVTRLRIHSLAWEVYDWSGEYSLAAACLDLEGLSEQCRLKLEIAFRKRESDFAEGHALSRQSYDLWRQRVMIVMMRGFAEYRLQNLTKVERWYAAADKFVANRLISDRFKCNGTLMWLRYFQGHLAHRQHQFQESRDYYDQALDYCRRRLSERLPTDVHGVEQEFSRYCVGKILLKLGELSYDWGRLSGARRHLESSLVLLMPAPDKFLRARASILLGITGRAEMRVGEQVKDLLDEFREALKNLAEHPVYRIEARLEQIVTAVYLLRERSPELDLLPDELQSIAKCCMEMEKVVKAADDLRMAATAFRARIARARILVRSKSVDPEPSRKADRPHHFPDLALAAIKEAESIYGFESIPPSLGYEARYVEGLAHEAKQNWPSAARAYGEAHELGRDNIVVRFSCLRRIANAYLHSRKFPEAQRFADECVSLAPQIRNKRLRLDLDELLRKLRHQKELRITYTPFLTPNDGHTQFDRFFIEQFAATIGKQPKELEKQENIERANFFRRVPLKQEEVVDLVRKWDRRISPASTGPKQP